MRKSEKINIILLLWLIILPIVGVATAAKFPSWVGIDENDTYIWTTTYDESPYEKYLSTFYEEELGLPEEVADQTADDDVDFDEDLQAIKIVILKVKEVKDDRVIFYINYYETEDRSANDWDLKEEDQRSIILKYDLDDFKDFVSASSGYGPLFVDTKIKWEELTNEVDEEFEKDWDSNDEKASASSDGKGISTEHNPDEDIYDDFTSTSRYSDDGVLIFYEWAYDGDTIIKYELEWGFFYQYYWFIIIGAVVLIAIVIIVVIIVKRRR